MASLLFRALQLCHMSTHDFAFPAFSTSQQLACFIPARFSKLGRDSWLAAIADLRSVIR